MLSADQFETQIAIFLFDPTMSALLIACTAAVAFRNVCRDLPLFSAARQHRRCNRKQGSETMCLASCDLPLITVRHGLQRMEQCYSDHVPLPKPRTRFARHCHAHLRNRRNRLRHCSFRNDLVLSRARDADIVDNTISPVTIRHLLMHYLRWLEQRHSIAAHTASVTYTTAAACRSAAAAGVYCCHWHSNVAAAAAGLAATATVTATAVGVPPFGRVMR